MTWYFYAISDSHENLHTRWIWATKWDEASAALPEMRGKDTIRAKS